MNGTFHDERCFVAGECPIWYGAALIHARSDKIWWVAKRRIATGEPQPSWRVRRTFRLGGGRHARKSRFMFVPAEREFQEQERRDHCQRGIDEDER